MLRTTKYDICGLEDPTFEVTPIKNYDRDSRSNDLKVGSSGPQSTTYVAVRKETF
jgi:hypothetical protein